ncbi:SDR family NAD(P)-dependent oxidoreductase [Dactylosporangium sp. AC04546]|uniref:SDR family NAD(P)-dependent oxidoreductase n=1 Tax=Dactylosporangium sp. AC04546 TaxID=2862460 RepID=UPI001EDF46E3|nr:SDR family NAD(P)-dependent oxidoreductase [Dactylosporangium sp. AC04546]WVK86914.1 SDR family NAD(P)-dependent oxidoreductase [Dactylosporangium sp. AC04546]
MTDLAGTVVVITGAADGIGRALAGAFATAGARLVLADINRPLVEAVGRELSQLGTEVMTAGTDVSSREQVVELRDAAIARFGTVHVLCNNAGVMGPAGDPLWELPIDEWQRVMAVNLWGVLHGIQAFLPAILAAGQPGHVLNTASMQGVTSGTLIPEYTVSKHAVVALSEALRAQLTARGAPVGVTVLCPGAVVTDLASREYDRLTQVGDGKPWAVAPGGGGGQQRWGSSALTPAEVAAAAVTAVQQDRFYVFTSPGSRTRVEARLGPILDALDALDALGGEGEGGPA